eukprot:EG_transcript_23154
MQKKFFISSSIGNCSPLQLCAGTGTFLCCTNAAVCRLKTADEIDNCYDGHSKGHCCSVKQYKELGWKECVCTSSSGRSTCCFCIEQKQNYECRCWPTTCCKCAGQELCCDFRAALPFDEELPCGCAICGKWFSGSPEGIKEWRTGPPSQYMGSQQQVVGGK